jgi:hypothetical protein
MAETTQFPGETLWSAIVNDHSLNIEEEESFLTFCSERNVDPLNTTLEMIESLYAEWQAER